MNTNNVGQHTVMVDVEGLAMDLATLEMDRDSSDMVFVVGRDEARVSGHAAIFNVRCSSFVELVSNNTEDNHQPGLITVNLTFLSSEAFVKFVHFVYSGQMDVNNVNVFEVMAISSLFGVDSLTKWCSNYVKNTLTLTSAQQYLNEAAAIPDKIPDKMSLVRHAVQYVGENIITLRDRQLLDQVNKEALVLLVKSQYLCLNSNDVWRFCLNWAKDQARMDANKAPQVWSDEERNFIRSALEGVVQHIRVLQIDSAVFAEEVEPTGAIPIELSLERYRQAAFSDKSARDQRQRQEDRLEQADATQRSGRGHMRDDQAGGRALSRPRNEQTGRRALSRPREEADLSRLNIRAEMQNNMIDGSQQLHSSNILTAIDSPQFNYSNILNCWYGNPHQAWTVIYRASEHNFQAAAFHDACDGASPTYILVKSDTGYVSGGFTAIPWSRPTGKGRYIASDNSFLFSLYSPQRRQPRQFAIKKKLFAVSHHPDCGPVFGAGADLFICDNCDKVGDSYSNLPHSYDGDQASSSCLMGEYSFMVEEYEVLIPVQG
eukprot:TRINITY_DN14201_c0_g1_i5.p1 TRINITY_DN14201_c0_g1~~TRINITY_DN14201_c0_g1_i5.p1  ORF type:complete len:545 (-),score=143.55 TRINITY_DN14201_c0_g1_i5:24-1658(-)